MATSPVARKAEGEAASSLLGLIVLGVSASAMVTATRARRPGPQNGPSFLVRSSIRPPASLPAPAGPVAGLRVAAALLGLSVFADSAVEHSRGLYKNPGMYAPVGISALLVSGNVGGLLARGSDTGVRDSLHATSFMLGIAGVGFHAFNVLHRPGGLSWHNMFYAAPVGAPAALALAGLIGFAADHVDVGREGPATLAGLPAGRVLAGLVAFGLIGTTAEVTLLHFRGNFQSKYMWLPVTMPPVAAILLAASAIRPERSGLPATRAWLGLTAAIGFAGVAFHARGISRMMGGWRNWTQNLADGPPLPAPPSFSALALAGLAALSLMERDND